jgi:hypothetical protein
VIHLRVVSPPDVTSTLLPLLRSEPAVLNLTMLPGAVAHPDGDAVHFDVLHGAANEVIGRLRDLGLDQRGSIVLENVDTSISAHAERATPRRGRFQQFTPVWAEVESRIALEGSFPPSWFALLAVAGALLLALIIRGAGLAGVVGVVSLTEARSATLIGVFISVTTIPAASDTGVSLAFGNGSEAWGSVLQLLLNVTVLTAVAVAGLPAQRAIWRRAARLAAAAPPGLRKTGG